MAPLRVLLSGAAGQIGYALIPLLCSGQVFGQDRMLDLVLLDIPPMAKVLQGVVMEVMDGAYDNVASVVGATEYDVAFKGVEVAILVGGFPRKAGMLRKDLLAKNRDIFVAAGQALDKYADKNCKVLVVANPANTNCLVAATNAPTIPRKNFTALTRLDMNRAKGQIAERLGTTSKSVRNIFIWGNHSASQVPDAYNAVFVGGDDKKEQLVRDLVKDDAWLTGEFMKTVQQRGAAVIKARGLSSAMSAANAVKDHLRDWFLGTKEGEIVAMAVPSEGNPYGIAEGLIYSFPVRCKGGEYEIVKDMKSWDRVKELMKVTEEELVNERKIALGN